MKTPCPHCSAVIEIDPATHTMLAGQSHFACPACKGAVPVPAVVRPRLKLSTALGTNATVSAPPEQRYHRAFATPRATLRNFLTLGATALLMLGGIAVFLASRNSANSHQVTDSIHNEIINNSYFQNLIATGVTTRKNLDAIATIRPYEEGFIGISVENLDWQQANDLAHQAGAVVLSIGPSTDTSDTRLMSWLAEAFPKQTNHPLWVSKGGVPAVLSSPRVHFVTSSEGPKKMVLCWHKNYQPAALHPWVNPNVPLPDAEGWITLFDGEKLRGCSSVDIVKAGNKVRIEGGALLLNDTWVQFPINTRNVAVRAEVRNVNGMNLALGCRELPGNRKYSSWFNGRGSRHGDFGIGMAAPKWRPLKGASASKDFESFFPMEFIAKDSSLTLSVDGRMLVNTDNMEVNEAGRISVRSLKGLSQFKNIQVKILDQAPRRE